MKKEILIGVLAITALIVAGCTLQAQQSPQKIAYGQGLTECEVLRITFGPQNAGTGQEKCEENGYSLCTEQKTFTKLTYYENINDCIGPIQSESNYLKPVNCNIDPTVGGGGGCGINNDGAEPYFGAYATEDGTIYPVNERFITCCK